ncbi:hypothetical protein Q5425_05230 [Amycolatopsis sp. A133]|nr:hypothetical protein [Amycolatopsis sp. A133]MDQ7803120.1 hypothetical protein [Amycolatopsis sp. A133]
MGRIRCPNRSFAQAEGTARQVLLAPQDFLDPNLEIEAVRAGILDRYLQIDRPIRMIMATSMAGDGDAGRTGWRNRNWRAGVERLVRAWPCRGLTATTGSSSPALRRSPG